MNQILSTNMPYEDNKNKKNKTKKTNNKGPVDIEKILKVFAIVLVVFGVFMVGTGSYAIYKNQVEGQETEVKPTISIENKTDTIVLLKIMHQKYITEVQYGWNDEEKTVVNGNERKYIEQEITIPSGTNTLHVIVKDENGQEITYDKQYEIESNINFEVSGNKIKITSSSEKTISYMTYRWDDQEEQTININSTELSQEIDAMKGLHTLTVVTVDEDNNTDTKAQKINGVSKPKVEVKTDETDSHFVVIASDETPLQKMEIRLNQDDNQQYVIKIDEKTDFTCTLPMELKQGENLIEVTVYNTEGITGKFAGKFVK